VANRPHERFTLRQRIHLIREHPPTLGKTR
jgi:hypothetical protein